MAAVRSILKMAVALATIAFANVATTLGAAAEQIWMRRFDGANLPTVTQERTDGSLVLNHTMIMRAPNGMRVSAVSWDHTARTYFAVFSADDSEAPETGCGEYYVARANVTGITQAEINSTARSMPPGPYEEARRSHDTIVGPIGYSEGEIVVATWWQQRGTKSTWNNYAVIVRGDDAIFTRQTCWSTSSARARELLGSFDVRMTRR